MHAELKLHLLFCFCLFVFDLHINSTVFIKSLIVCYNVINVLKITTPISKNENVVIIHSPTERTQRGHKLLKKKSLFYFLCIQKVFLSHKIQIEPLIADGVFW